MKKINWIWWIIIGVILLGGFLLFLWGDEDTWIKDSSGNWQKHGNPTEPAPFLIE